MARTPSLEENEVVSLRVEKDILAMLRELAALESLHAARVVTVNELIRNAIEFTYSDNERLRECFRRTRAHIQKKMMFKK